MDLFLQQVLNGLAIGSVYALFALGFGLVFATMGALNIAQGTYAAMGAIATWAALDKWGLPTAPAILVGIVVGALLGVATDIVAFQPLRRRNVGLLGTIITSIGVWFILGTLAQRATGYTPTRYPNGSIPDTIYEVAGLQFRFIQVVNVVTMIAIGTLLHLALQRTRWGASVRAVGYDFTSATISGVSPTSVARQVIGLGAAISALAGVLGASATNNVSYEMGEGLLFKGFAAVIVGGFGDVRGTVAGGVLIGLVEVLGAQYVSNSFRDALTFGLLFLVLLLRPQGLLAQIGTVRA